MWKIENLIYEIDKLCRREFENGAIVCERDYVSNFSSFIRFPNGPFGKINVGHCQTNPSNIETNFGIDGIIILKNDSKVHIGVFEAKIIKDDWDSTVGKTKSISRFGRQLNKQKHNITNSKIAKWEMFLNNSINEDYLDKSGSTCVKFEFADKFKKTGKTIKWSRSDLNSLLKHSYIDNLKIPINIEQIIHEMISGKFGSGIPEKDDITINKLKVPLNIPDGYTKEIESFLIGSELSYYMIFDVSKQNNYIKAENTIGIIDEKEI